MMEQSLPERGNISRKQSLAGRKNSCRELESTFQVEFEQFLSSYDRFLPSNELFLSPNELFLTSNDPIA